MSLEPDHQPPLNQGQVETLRARLEGSVFLPGEADYEEARLAWNRSVRQHPALIVMAASPSDIVAAVGFAREADLGIAVQGAGHGVRRPADGCLLINTSRLTGVRIDAAARTAWVAAGTKWGAVLPEAQAVGLAPLLGSSPDVGAVGYTLGGGIGWLARQYGLSSDSVRRFEVVTVDGQKRIANESENADLFWGLRGGGGSLAIITGMEIRLHPVTTVTGGNLIYPVERAREVFRRYRSWIESAPDELTSSALIMNYPPVPDVPEPLRGQSFVQVRGCFCGPDEQAEALLRFWREWQTPLIDDFKPMPFSQVAAISADPVDPQPETSTGAWLKTLDDATIDTVIRHTAPGSEPSPLTFAEVRHVGGAIAAIDPASSAFSHRQERLSLQMVGPTGSPAERRAFIDASQGMKRDLGAALSGGVYLNFLEGQESQDRTRDGFSPDAYLRLCALKARFDPENRLRYSFAIPPAAD